MKLKKVINRTININYFGINGFSSVVFECREKKKLKNILFVVFLLVALLSYALAMYTLFLSDELAEIGRMDVVILLSFICSVISSFIISEYYIQNTIYNKRESEIMSSLPVESVYLLKIKIENLLKINYIVLSVILIPTNIIFFYKYEALSYLYFIRCIFLFLFLPLMPIVFSIIISRPINYCISKINKKTMEIVSFITLFAILLVSIKFQNIVNEFTDNSAEVITNASKYFLLSNLYTKGLISFNLGSVLGFIITSMFLSILGLYWTLKITEK